MKSQVPSLDCKKYPQQTAGLMNTLQSVRTVQQQNVCESYPQVSKSEINPVGGRGHQHQSSICTTPNFEASQHPQSPGFIVKWKIKVQGVKIFCQDPSR